MIKKLKQWFSKITNWIFFISMLCIVGAVFSPFYFYWRYSDYGDYTGLAALGPVGDFVGGTTVTFFTAASVFLLIATNIMQREELKASVEQARLARTETQITNETMKQQQFETTFFNMINLQHNILKEIQYGDYAGREAIVALYEELENIYDDEIYKQYRTKFINDIVTSGNINRLNDLVKKSLIGWGLWRYTHEFDSYFMPTTNGNGEEDFSELEAFYKSLSDGTNKEWNKIEADIIQDFEKNIKNKGERCGEILGDFDFKSYFKNESENENKIKHEYITEFKMNYYDDSLIELKHEAYEILYKKHENLIGHYYRNLYRIVKLIQDNTFDSESQERDNEEKRKYRGILRAQLSSFELLMLFYNISYSEKGKNFKKLITGINFFDDHLIEEDFIWKNDVEELASLNASKGATETNSI
ncbi:putative phage abortive infection protein [Bacillus cereus]|uniref:putative phage abortive infection protein n=1 Tax=Bacillus cereus TaxID=1396 RepID=UPI003D2EA4E1